MNKCYCGYEFTKKELLKLYSKYSRQFNEDIYIKCPKCGRLLVVETRVKDVDFEIKKGIEDREPF